MYTVTDGSEKQNKYANDIIRKPIANMEKNIAEIEHDSVLLAEKTGKRNPQLDIIPILRKAITLYEETIDYSSDSLTAKVVIDSYKRQNTFQHAMWKCLLHAFREAGHDVDIHRVANWAAP